MSLSINLNSAALTAHRNLAASGNAASQSIARLSSGYKINSASDDPAGLVISEKLRAQASGLGQAISNAGDASNMTKTAEGALNETNTLLRSMRDLALHAANAGANDSAATAADQEQIKSAISSLNNISSETQFGNKKLLNGDAGVSIKLSSASVTSADLSKATLAKGSTAVTVDVTTKADYAKKTGTVDLSGGAAADGSIFINGVSVDYKTGDSVDTMVSNINKANTQTGVTASKSGDGKNLILTSDTVGSTGTITLGQSAALMGAAPTTVAGVDAVATVKDSSGAAVGGTWNKGNGNTLQDDLGNTINLATGTGVATLTDAFSAENNSLEFQVGAYAGQTRTVSIGSSAADKLGTSAISGKNVSTIDVTTAQGAQDAVKILDAAISQVSTQRAALGAFQKNVLDSTVNSLTAAKENITASESSIRDTDMAAEMSNFTKNNVLQQAGISMLSQANQMPQQLLSLLR